MALKLNGKDDRLTPQDFVRLARTIDVPVGRAEALMGEVARGVRQAAAELVTPLVAAEGAATIERVREIADTRTAAFV